MGDYQVHRMRIGDWVPSPIKSIDSDIYSTRVAVGREDGDIEICDSGSKWYCQARIPGRKDFKLQSLVWSTQKSEQGRLFGISLRGFVFEVDLATLNIKNIRDSYGGAAWCVASSSRSPVLAVGCEDGQVRIYSYDGANLEFQKTLPVSGSRIVSIAYHPTEPLLFIGCIDGTIRCMDENTGRVILRMTGDALKGSARSIFWSLIVLKDSTVVTGDNKGNVQFWDGEKGVMLDTFRQHTADVMTLATSHDENSVFSSGVDGKVICFQKSAGENNWVYSHSHRAHSHDVYSLSLCYSPSQTCTDRSRPAPNSQTGSSQSGHWILLSGGLDTKMCTYSVTNFVKVRPSWIPAIPSNLLVNHSENYNVVTLRHRDHLDVWSVSLKQLDQIKDANEKEDDSCRLKLRLQSGDDEHIHSSALSKNGQYIVVTSTSGIRLWRLEQLSTSTELKAVTLPSILKTSGEFYHAIQFNNASTQLAVFNSAKAVVLLFNIVDHSGAEGGICLELASSFDHRHVVQKVDQLEGLHLAVKEIEFSEDDRYLAVCSAAEEVYVYDTSTQKLQWRLPQFTNSISSLKFIRPPHVAKTSVILFVLLSNNSFLMLDVIQKKLHTWSETNGVDKIPKYILQMPGSLSGIALNESNNDKLILYGQGYCVLINLSDKIPNKPRVMSQCTTALMQKNMSKKRKATRSEDSTDSVTSLAATDVGTNFVVVNIYRNLLHVGCLKNDELVVIENPWMRTAEALPEVLERKRYGV